MCISRLLPTVNETIKPLFLVIYNKNKCCNCELNLCNFCNCDLNSQIFMSNMELSLVKKLLYLMKIVKIYKDV